jgi:hypothetical protein
MGGCWKRSTVKTRKNIYLDAPKRPVKINPKYRLAYILPRPRSRPTYLRLLPPIGNSAFAKSRIRSDDDLGSANDSTALLKLGVWLDSNELKSFICSLSAECDIRSPSAEREPQS